jgi:hypothetical protein
VHTRIGRLADPFAVPVDKLEEFMLELLGSQTA